MSVPTARWLLVKLLYFPYVSLSGQRGTALLLIISNIAVVLIHGIMFIRGEGVGTMLFINFIGPEPKSVAKIVFLDILIILLQAMLLQCKWEGTDIRLVSIAPVPLSRSVPPILTHIDEPLESDSPGSLQHSDSSPT